MPIYKRGPGYIVSVGSGSSRYRDTFPNLVAAEAAHQKETKRRKESPREPTIVDAPKGKTLKDAFDLAYKLQWKGTKAEKTMCINGTSCLKELGPNMELTALTRDDISEMIEALEEQGNTGATINRKLSCLSVMLKQAIDQETWGLQRLIKIPRKAESSGRIRWLDENEELQVLATCEHLGLEQLKDYIIMAIDTGFRRSELLGLVPRDYTNGMLHLHHGQTKNDDARAIPATGRVVQIIQNRKHLRSLFEGFSPHILRYQWERLRSNLGLLEDPQFVVHMLRHTCASRLVQRGVPLAMVQKWMGHKDINTTLRYAHLSPDSLMGAKVALERFNGIATQVTQTNAQEF